jgi:FkbM family methyltransferase
MVSPRSTLTKVGRRAVKVVRNRLRTPREHLVDQWHAESGDITRRLDFPLDRESVVVDGGGYQGQYASDIYATFRCRVHVYEPVRAFADFTRRRFASNPDIVVHDVGLAANTRTERIALEDDASSVLAGAAARTEEIRLAAVTDELSRIGHVTLLKLNIEGLEYEVLESLLDAGRLTHIEHLLVQFHDFVPDAADRRERIRTGLSATHELRWDFPFVWEAWQRRQRP